MKGNPLKQFYAFLANYFWLPCPFPGCGRYFGGFETGDYSVPTDRPGHYKMTCKRHNHLEVERHEAMVAEWRKKLGISE